MKYFLKNSLKNAAVLFAAIFVVACGGGGSVGDDNAQQRALRLEKLDSYTLRDINFVESYELDNPESDSSEWTVDGIPLVDLSQFSFLDPDESLDLLDETLRDFSLSYFYNERGDRESTLENTNGDELVSPRNYEYTYDKNGMPLTRVYSYAALDRSEFDQDFIFESAYREWTEFVNDGKVISYDYQSYTYNENGDLLSEYFSESKFDYDFEGKVLSRTREPLGESAEVVREYVYNNDGTLLYSLSMLNVEDGTRSATRYNYNIDGTVAVRESGILDGDEFIAYRIYEYYFDDAKNILVRVGASSYDIQESQFREIDVSLYYYEPAEECGPYYAVRFKTFFSSVRECYYVD